jgi:hypothetical protein
MTLRLFVLAACMAIAKLVAAAAPVLGEVAAPVAGAALGSVIRTTNAEELRFYVLRQLTDRYATQKGIAVSRAEIDQYQRWAAAFRKEDRAKRAARLAVVERELQDAPLSPERRSVLASEADVLRSLRVNEEREAAKGAELSAEEKALLESIPRPFIRQRRINRALHRDYGGRVSGQQGGAGPLDAYRKFLEQAQARGDFVIVDRTLDAGLWQYYRDDVRHSFLPPGKATSRTFDTPPWAGRWVVA